MRHWLIALFLCACGSSTPSPANDMAQQQQGGDLASTNHDFAMSTSGGDMAMSSTGGDMAFVCGKPGMTGNEKGVGQYCTAGGGQCMNGSFCPADFGFGQTFCTVPCTGTSDTTSCGTNAECQCQGGQCGCIPSCCLNASC